MQRYQTANSSSPALTHLVDGTSKGKIPVLAVHIVRARAGVVAEPDTVVLDNARVPLPQLFIMTT